MRWFLSHFEAKISYELYRRQACLVSASGLPAQMSFRDSACETTAPANATYLSYDLSLDMHHPTQYLENGIKELIAR